MTVYYFIQLLMNYLWKLFHRSHTWSPRQDIEVIVSNTVNTSVADSMVVQATRALTHWGQVTHIYVSKLTIIGSDNGLSPGQSQVIILTNAVILSIRPPATNFNEILIEIHIISFKKIHLKMSSGKWRPFCLSLNVLTTMDGTDIVLLEHCFQDQKC